MIKDITSNMNSIFEKLNDLKNLFKFGERIVPIIQSLIEFMKEVVPLLENINSSISDSANKMPQATNQIDNVTSATEMATTEILDLVDKITAALDNLSEKFKEVEQQHSQRSQLIEKLKILVAGNTEAEDIVDRLLALDLEGKHISSAHSLLDSIKDDTYQITLSLQVQDITAQQLAAANHLIQSVHNKLATLIADIDDSEIKDSIPGLEIVAPKGATFDPKAEYKKDGKKQQEADDIINQQKNTGQQASQDEIDKLFS